LKRGKKKGKKDGGTIVQTKKEGNKNPNLLKERRKMIPPVLVKPFMERKGRDHRAPSPGGREKKEKKKKGSVLEHGRGEGHAVPRQQSSARGGGKGREGP